MAVDATERIRFGARLRHAREASRLSLGDVAARSGVTKSFLARVERDVLSGSIEVQVEDETFELAQGDALTFGAAVPHSWRVLGDLARILWILAPALPDPQRWVR